MTQALRQRLDRIYGGPPGGEKALRSRLEKLSGPRHPRALADHLRGHWVESSAGRVLTVDRSWPISHRHGGCLLGDVFRIRDEQVRVLAGNGGFASFDPRRLLFLDTETTGLAGGAGTCVFLVGVGFFHRDTFRTRQLFLPGYDSERAFLEELRHVLARHGPFQHLVSFNGKSYDLNLLDNRFVMQRLDGPFRALDHLDLLYPSRLFWRGAFEDCALQTLERRLFGLRRSGDIPSSLIPRIYFNYLQSGRFRPFDRVFRHNRTDLLTMVSLIISASRLVEEPDESLFVDGRRVARLHTLRGNHAKAEQILERVPRGEPEVDFELALLKRKLGKHDEALHLFRQVIDGSPRPPREAIVAACKILEHRNQDFRGAFDLVERGLRFYRCAELEHRRHRLQCRMEGRSWY